jgi:lytic murein transglycosylase
MRYATASLIAIALSVGDAQQPSGQPASAGQEAFSKPQAPPSFQSCLAGIEWRAQLSGISNAIIDAHLKNLWPDPDVAVAPQGQAEFERPIWEYIDAAVSEARVSTGQGRLAEWRALLDVIDGKFGVDRHILVAIWGIESSYGAALEDADAGRPVVRSLATLACSDESRAAFWREQLVAALQMLDRKDATLDQMTGSWAGAMGHTQFMPTTYQSYAVDFDGDGTRDIWRSIPDALASTANYLSSLGWRSGERWGYEVELPPGFDYSLADETTERELSEWIGLGLRLNRDHAIIETRKTAVLVLPTGARGPAFLLLPNFRVILGYNTAMAYALSVAHLSDRLRGDQPLARAWPREDRMLTNAERKELQELLAKRGFELGAVDGKVGPKTRAAIRAYQMSIGLLPDGYASGFLLDRARGVP